MEKIRYKEQEGVFIPLNEFDNGKFFNEKELHELRTAIVEQRQLIERLEKDVRTWSVNLSRI